MVKALSFYRDFLKHSSDSEYVIKCIKCFGQKQISQLKGALLSVMALLEAVSICLSSKIMNRNLLKSSIPSHSFILLSYMLVSDYLTLYPQSDMAFRVP